MFPFSASSSYTANGPRSRSATTRSTADDPSLVSKIWGTAVFFHLACWTLPRMMHRHAHCSAATDASHGETSQADASSEEVTAPDDIWDIREKAYGDGFWSGARTTLILGATGYLGKSLYDHLTNGAALALVGGPWAAGGGMNAYQGDDQEQEYEPDGPNNPSNLSRQEPRTEESSVCRTAGLASLTIGSAVGAAELYSYTQQE